MSDDIRKKLDRLDERLDNIDRTLVKQEANLGEHMRRTALLEDDFKPVKRHVELVNAAAKVLSVLLTVALAAKSLGLI